MTADDIMAYKPPETDVEHKCGVESLNGLNRAIISLAADYGDILNLYRGNGMTADAARKRHRSVIAKKIETERETTLDAENKPLKKLSDANLEIAANASPEHIAFCDKLALDGCQYELVRAQKEALEARRESRKAELYLFGKLPELNQ